MVSQVMTICNKCAPSHVKLIFRCEMQLLYSLAPDIILLRAIPGEEVKLEESEEAKVVKGKGTDIHLQRGKPRFFSIANFFDRITILTKLFGVLNYGILLSMHIFVKTAHYWLTRSKILVPANCAGQKAVGNLGVL